MQQTPFEEVAVTSDGRFMMMPETYPAMHERTKEDTEAAYDLLQLSQSLPPLPNPSDITAQNNWVSQPRPVEATSADDPYAFMESPDEVTYRQYYVTTAKSENNDEIPGNQDSAADVTALTPAASESTSDEDTTNGGQHVPKQMRVLVRAITYAYSSLSDGRKKLAVKQTSKAQDYTCVQCGKKYATSSNLSRHKQTHRSLDSKSAQKCNTCGKVYVSMPALSMHLLTHRRCHACDKCGKLFSRPWLLQGHYRSHTGEKPYGCAHCGKAFADRSNLRAHMLTHSNVKLYQCDRCYKSFNLKSYLNRHKEVSCTAAESFTDDGYDYEESNADNFGSCFEFNSTDSADPQLDSVIQFTSSSN